MPKFRTTVIVEIEVEVEADDFAHACRRASDYGSEAMHCDVPSHLFDVLTPLNSTMRLSPDSEQS